ncbi:hypothetical protein Gorai_020906 [Gossypium raimondii]|uniref:X8 domain-containing protein n=1 Tax=Gossypium raimondii TaxID=29730 RepID=A0A7J8NNQ9_GOSRA|nr:hypothetical protein [Gossypium raimondii]
MAWACGGGGADCSKIQMNQPCYFPKTMLLMHSMITTKNSSTKVVLAISEELPWLLNLIPVIKIADMCLFLDPQAIEFRRFRDVHLS